MKSALRAWSTLWFVCLLGHASNAQARDIPEYSIRSLGKAFSVEALNNLGVAVGSKRDDVGNFLPLLFKGGDQLQLGLLGGIEGHAYDINDDGVVAGWAENEKFDTRAVVWAGKTPVDLGTLGGSDSRAFGINAAGWVVGWAHVRNGGFRKPFLYDGLAMHDLNPNGVANSEALALNDLGTVVGYLRVVGTFDDHAFRFEKGILQDIGGLPGSDESYAFAVNNSGVIVGTSELVGFGCCEETLWEGREVRDLDSPTMTTNRAFAINEAGEIVGESIGRAFVWRQGEFHYLDDLIPGGSGWVLRYAKDINQRGQIVGIGELHGSTQGYLLTPRAKARSVRPDPIRDPVEDKARRIPIDVNKWLNEHTIGIPAQPHVDDAVAATIE